MMSLMMASGTGSNLLLARHCSNHFTLHDSLALTTCVWHRQHSCAQLCLKKWLHINVKYLFIESLHLYYCFCKTLTSALGEYCKCYMIIAFFFQNLHGRHFFFSFSGMQFCVVMWLSLRDCKTRLTVDIYSRYFLVFKMFHFTN